MLSSLLAVKNEPFSTTSRETHQPTCHCCISLHVTKSSTTPCTVEKTENKTHQSSFTRAAPTDRLGLSSWVSNSWLLRRHRRRRSEISHDDWDFTTPAKIFRILPLNIVGARPNKIKRSVPENVTSRLTYTTLTYEWTG